MDFTTSRRNSPIYGFVRFVNCRCVQRTGNESTKTMKFLASRKLGLACYKKRDPTRI